MDKSETSLKGKKLSKAQEIFEALGDLDELNACLGLARSLAKPFLKREILQQQDDLIEIGGFLAGLRKGDFLKEKTAFLTKRIDDLKQTKVRGFSRPGVNQISACLHLARALSRRLERRLIRLGNKAFKPLVAFFNSFSLYLFWLAKKEEKI